MFTLTIRSSKHKIRGDATKKVKKGDALKFLSCYSRRKVACAVEKGKFIAW
jgi:hypothetical protein